MVNLTPDVIKTIVNEVKNSSKMANSSLISVQIFREFRKSVIEFNI
jgi:hypothetical protein